MQSASIDIKRLFVGVHLASMKISAPVTVSACKGLNTLPCNRGENESDPAQQKRLMHFENIKPFISNHDIFCCCLLPGRANVINIFVIAYWH